MNLNFCFKLLIKTKKYYLHKFIIVLMGHQNILVLYESSFALELKDTQMISIFKHDIKYTCVLCVHKRKMYFDKIYFNHVTIHILRIYKQKRTINNKPVNYKLLSR